MANGFTSNFRETWMQVSLYLENLSKPLTCLDPRLRPWLLVEKLVPEQTMLCQHSSHERGESGPGQNQRRESKGLGVSVFYLGRKVDARL